MCLQPEWRHKKFGTYLAQVKVVLMQNACLGRLSVRFLIGQRTVVQIHTFEKKVVVGTFYSVRIVDKGSYPPIRHREKQQHETGVLHAARFQSKKRSPTRTEKQGRPATVSPAVKQNFHVRKASMQMLSAEPMPYTTKRHAR